MSNAIESQTASFHIGQEVSPTTFIKVGEIQEIGGPSGSADIINVSHLDSTAQEKLLGLPDEGQITLRGNYIPTDNGQVEMLEAKATRQRRDFKITLSNGQIWSGQCFVMAFNLEIAVNQQVRFSATIEITGSVART